MARRLGATEAQLAALTTGELSALDQPSRAAIAYATEMTAVGGRVSADSYANLAASWRPDQIVEITAVAALFNYFNRFAVALDIPVTR